MYLSEKNSYTSHTNDGETHDTNGAQVTLNPHTDMTEVSGITTSVLDITQIKVGFQVRLKVRSQS